MCGSLEAHLSVGLASCLEARLWVKFVGVSLVAHSLVQLAVCGCALWFGAYWAAEVCRLQVGDESELDVGVCLEARSGGVLHH